MPSCHLVTFEPSRRVPMPQTSLEVVITIVVQLFGAVLFGWIIGNIAALIADFNPYESAYKLRMEQIKVRAVCGSNADAMGARRAWRAGHTSSGGGRFFWRSRVATDRRGGGVCTRRVDAVSWLVGASRAALAGLLGA